MGYHVKRVGLIKHEIWCDNIWEYLTAWTILITICALAIMAGIAGIQAATTAL